MAANDRTLAAAGMILAYAALIGFTDNHVRTIAAEAGLWQFHLTRSVMALALLALAAPLLGLRLMPVSWRAVVARSSIHGSAMLVYFGAIAFLPVPLVVAGLFTAPIFVLLIQRFAFGEPIGPVRIAAVALGFLGVVLVLGPEALEGSRLAALLPIAAGALYALGNIATRRWCGAESAATLLAGFFAALGLLGALGMGLLALHPLAAPEGADGFLLRGAAWPGSGVWFWIFVQAAGSLVAVGLAVKGYQLTEATRASIFEYLVLPSSALWAWVIWGDVLKPLAWGGIGLIVLAGLMIATQAARQARA